jgi:carbon storage regulator
VLVFTRKLDQAIVIGAGIEITVLRIGRDSVRLGVTAARDVPVHRAEIYEAIRRANAAAAADAGALAALVTKLRESTPEG